MYIHKHYTIQPGGKSNSLLSQKKKELIFRLKVLKDWLQKCSYANNVAD